MVIAGELALLRFRARRIHASTEPAMVIAGEGLAPRRAVCDEAAASTEPAMVIAGEGPKRGEPGYADVGLQRSRRWGSPER